MSVTIKFRRGTESEWITNGSVVLASGEPGFEVNTGRLKIGNGTSQWSSLPYASVIPSGFIGISGINVQLGTNGSTATISVSGLNSSYISNFNTTVSGLLPTISNSGDNRILTSTGSDVGINAENNLTFNGNLLNVSGSGAFSSNLQVVGTGRFTNVDINNSAIAGTSALTVNGSISTQSQSIIAGQFSMYGDQNTRLYKPNVSTFAMSSANSGISQSFGYLLSGFHVPWMTITNSGIGIGTTSPTSQLHVIGTGNFSQNLLVNGTGVSLSGHTHTASQITDFNEAVDDRIGSGLFLAGTGINLNYNDSSNTFTVSVSGLVNNPTNNRILTSRDNTTTGIDAETNATFDGSIFRILGGGGSGILCGYFGSESAHKIILDNDDIRSEIVADNQMEKLQIKCSEDIEIIAGMDALDASVSISPRLNVDNLRLDGNTISSTNANGDLILSTSGSGKASIGTNNLASASNSFVNGTNNVAASKVRRANSIFGSTNTITVLNAVAADFDNTTANALQIRYFSNNTWNLITRTVSSAVQGTGGDSANVTVTLTSNVGVIGQFWTNVTVINTSETETMVGGTVGGMSNIATANYSTIGGGSFNSSSGSGSTIGGGSFNSSSGNNSTVGGGSFNSSSGNYSTIGGGRYNSSSGNYSTIGGGRYNSSSGNYSTIGGGRFNSSSGSGSTIGGGRYNSLSGSGSTIGGGVNNSSSGSGSTIGGGRYNSSSGNYSTVPGGLFSKATRYGELSHAAGSFLNAGDAQHTILIAKRVTSNNTANQVLFLDASSARLTLPAKTTWTFEVKLSAYNDTDNAAAGWIFRGAIRRNDANGTQIVGSIIEENWKETAMNNATASVVADDTNEALEIRVTGLTGKNIRWVAVVDISQVSYGTP